INEIRLVPARTWDTRARPACGLSFQHKESYVQTTAPRYRSIVHSRGGRAGSCSRSATRGRETTPSAGSAGRAATAQDRRHYRFRIDPVARRIVGLVYSRVGRAGLYILGQPLPSDVVTEQGNLWMATRAGSAIPTRTAR